MSWVRSPPGPHSKIELDDKLENAWEQEERLPEIQKWRGQIETAESPEERLCLEIKVQYEEMYMVRDWESLGGIITHYSRVDPRWRKPTETGVRYDNLIQGLSAFSGKGEEELHDLMDRFKNDYSYAASEVVAMISAYPAVPQDARKRYLNKLQVIRQNPDYAIFFKSHFAKTYEQKFKKLGLIK